MVLAGRGTGKEKSSWSHRTVSVPFLTWCPTRVSSGQQPARWVAAHLTAAGDLWVQRLFWYAGREADCAESAPRRAPSSGSPERTACCSGPAPTGVLKEPEFPSTVLFGFRFGFLLGSRGGSLLRIRRGCDLSFLDGMEFPQHWLQLVFLLLKVQLHATTTEEDRI